MDEGACIAVEIDTFLRIEEHILAGVDLQNEVLQRTHTYNPGNLTTLFLSHIIEFAQFHRGLVGIFHHQFHQVVSVNNRSLTAFHLTIRQFHHTVGEVCQFLTPLEAEAVEQNTENLEVIILLVTHHVDHLVDGIILETHLCRTDVLSHINAGAIGAEQQFLVKAFVGKVCPDGVVLVAFEESFGEAFLNLGLTLEVGLRLVVNLIE